MGQIRILTGSPRLPRRPFPPPRPAKPWAPGAPGGPVIPLILISVGFFGVMQIRLHPSEQHFCVPSQSLSIRQLPIRLSGGGHSDLSEGSISGHTPSLTSEMKKRKRS